MLSLICLVPILKKGQIYLITLNYVDKEKDASKDNTNYETYSYEEYEYGESA